MIYIEGVFFFTIALLLLGIIRFVTVLLHELSHAFLALLYTKNTIIEIFIGSMGESIKKGYHWKWGNRLYFYVQFAPWKLLGGLCRYSKTQLSWEEELKILLIGSFTSFGLMIFASLVIKYNAYGIANLLGNYLLLCAIIDFFTNLISRKKPFELYDGSTQLTDIDQIKKLFEVHDIKLSQAIKSLFKLRRNQGKKTRVSKRVRDTSKTKGHRVSDN